MAGLPPFLLATGYSTPPALPPVPDTGPPLSPFEDWLNRWLHSLPGPPGPMGVPMKPMADDKTMKTRTHDFCFGLEDQVPTLVGIIDPSSFCISIVALILLVLFVFGIWSLLR